MARWQTLIDSCLKALSGLLMRKEIDRAVSEYETIAAYHTEAASWDETPDQRRQEFQRALRDALAAKRAADSRDKAWSEALVLLDNPRLRKPR